MDTSDAVRGIAQRVGELARSIDLSVCAAPPTSVDDVRALARRRLPRAIFDFVEGGADDEITLSRNVASFGAVEFLPRPLVDVSTVSCAAELFGERLAAPVVLAPTGLTRLIHPAGELAVAGAAARRGLPYVLSSMGSTPLEDVGRSTNGAKYFQLYVWRDRGRLRDLFRRATDAGFSALELTVDVPVLGSRERDARNGMSIPPRLRLPALHDAARHPGWWTRYVASDPVTLSAVTASGSAGAGDASLKAYVDSQFDPSVTWDDLAWMVSAWPGRFIVKGVLDPGVATRCVDLGVDAVIVSNHGGRQLDRTPGAFDALGPVVDAVGSEIPVLMDGGVRRGADVVAALASGATAVQIGRPYLYGLAADGERGVDVVLRILIDEIRRTMALLGCANLDAIDGTLLR